MEDRLKKIREERTAREEARIKKLREINLKKYSKNELQASASAILPVVEKDPKTGTVHKSSQPNVMKTAKSGTHVNCKRPIIAPVPMKKPDYSNIKPKVMTKFSTTTTKKIDVKSTDKVDNKTKSMSKSESKIDVPKNAETSTKSVSNVLSKPDVIITKAKESGPEEKIASDSKMFDPKTIANNDDKPNSNINKIIAKPDILITTANSGEPDKFFDKKVLTDITKKKTLNTKLFPRNDVKLRKSLAAPVSHAIEKPNINARKSMLPSVAEGTKPESVFERLYKPKIPVQKTDQKPAEPEKKENLLRKVQSSESMYNFHLNTLLGKKPQAKFNQRRSISAMHYKCIRKSEISNSIQKWGSIGDNLHKMDLKNDDVELKEDKVISAVKSERKKVQFMTPVYSNFNTPKPDELQARLKSWLQKRGKCLSSFHHLQCFGLHHLKTNLSAPRPMKFEDALESPAPVFDEENKENVALESDSDNGSITELMGKQKEPVKPDDEIDITNWRNTSIASESVLNESVNYYDCTLSPDVDYLLYGALNELSTLLREGFDWQQAVRWLRSIRHQFPAATATAAYWECRAALEDARGNLTGSVECWKEAIAKGTEESVVDSNLDQLLDKFMQLKLSPRGSTQQSDPKLVDVKNVFKSNVIRFAVQQAKLRNKSAPTTPYTVTPVRRSSRLSQHVSRTPLRLCDTMQQAATIAPQHVFIPNENIVLTP